MDSLVVISDRPQRLVETCALVLVLAVSSGCENQKLLYDKNGLKNRKRILGLLRFAADGEGAQALQTVFAVVQ